MVIMAEKKAEAGELQERIYTIPLREDWLKGSRIRRGGRSARAIRKFLSRHMKAGSVKISAKLNEHIWERGLKRPPGKIRVKAHMDEDGVVTAMLPDEVVVKEEEKGRMEKLKERLSGGKSEEGKGGKAGTEEAKTPDKEKPPEGKEEPAEGKPLPEGKGERGKGNKGVNTK